MSEPFLAEIRMYGFNFAPRGWAFCDGQILPINQNQSLYSLLGTTYGGDGRTSFALPDLRGRVPIHVGQSTGGTDHTLGSKDGEENHVLTESETPVHNHLLNATSADANSPVPIDNLLASFNNAYADAAVDPATLISLRNESVSNAGSSQGHTNIQPSQVIAFAIALQGLFPSRN
jgi:microcystin-dependent protein